MSSTCPDIGMGIGIGYRSNLLFRIPVRTVGMVRGCSTGCNSRDCPVVVRIGIAFRISKGIHRNLAGCSTVGSI